MRQLHMLRQLVKHTVAERDYNHRTRIIDELVRIITYLITSSASDQCQHVRRTLFYVPQTDISHMQRDRSIKKPVKGTRLFDAVRPV